MSIIDTSQNIVADPKFDFFLEVVY